MRLLRKKLLKNICGVTLLSIMLLKICAFSISHFSSCLYSLAIEKCAEEGKDVKEEPVDKKEKKLYTYALFYIDHGQLLWISNSPLCMYSYSMQIGSHPLKTVPTPPPDYLV